MRLTTTIALLLIQASAIHAATEKHDFGDDVTAQIYKRASGDDLWIYRFDPPDHDAATDKRPAAVFFFGGGWNGGSVTQFEQHCRYLAARGMVAFVADYRVRSRQKTAPDACVADGKSAIRWVRRHAVQLGIDPQRIAAGGGSAGGHVAATTGICDGMDEASEQDSSVSSKSNALLLFNPVYDNGPEGYGHDRAKPWFPKISPAHNITADDPPTIVFLGSKDPLIPVRTAETFDANLKAAGITSQLWIYQDQPHGFFNESKSQDCFLDTVLKMDAFLISLGWLEGKPDQALLKTLLKKPGQVNRGKVSWWKGYVRYDFQVDGRPCHLVVPAKRAAGNPWVWRARFPDFHPEVDLLLLERGFCIAHMNTAGMLGSPQAMEHWDAFYELMTGDLGLSEQVALEAVSRGGLFAYRWASRHPQRVACLYADTPVCDFKSWPLGRGSGIGHPETWSRLLKEYALTKEQALAWTKNPIDVLRPLAEADVPLFHLISLNDRVVPPDENTYVLAERYRALGGSINIMTVPSGTKASNGHHFDPPDPTSIADFIQRSASATK